MGRLTNYIGNSSNWSVNIKFTTGSEVTTPQEIYGGNGNWNNLIRIKNSKFKIRPVNKCF